MANRGEEDYRAHDRPSPPDQDSDSDNSAAVLASNEPRETTSERAWEYRAEEVSSPMPAKGIQQSLGAIFQLAPILVLGIGGAVVIAVLGACLSLVIFADLRPVAGPSATPIPLCQRQRLTVVERQITSDPTLTGFPLTVQSLVSSVWIDWTVTTRAQSIHLIGPGHADVKHHIVTLLADANGASSCVHHVRGSTAESMQQEIYTAGRECPCSIIVWDDVEQIPEASRHLLKSLFDDNPANLKPKAGTALDSEVDVRRLTFVLMSSRPIPLTAAKVNSLPKEDIATAGHQLHVWVRQDVQAMGLWPDRITHVIRHHIPVIAAPSHPPPPPPPPPPQMPPNPSAHLQLES